MVICMVFNFFLTRNYQEICQMYAILKITVIPIMFKLIGPLWAEKLFIYNAYQKIKLETTMIEKSRQLIHIQWCQR